MRPAVTWYRSNSTVCPAETSGVFVQQSSHASGPTLPAPPNPQVSPPYRAVQLRPAEHTFL